MLEQNTLIQEILGQIITLGMDEEEERRAAYDYILASYSYL